jgi:hypothetical protein
MWCSKCRLVWSGGVVKYLVCPDKVWCDLAEPRVGWSGLAGETKGNQYIQFDLTRFDLVQSGSGVVMW